MRLTYVRDETGNLREQVRPGDASLPAAQPLTLDECRDLLRRNEIGRVGFLRYDRPILLPVTYGLDDPDDDVVPTIVWRSARGSKLWVAEHDLVSAAFEVDEYDRETGAGVSVVVRGPMRAVTDLIAAERLERLGIRTWADGVERPRWIQLAVRNVEGWRVPDG